MGGTSSIPRPENYFQSVSNPNYHGNFGLTLPHNLFIDIISRTAGGPSIDQTYVVRHTQTILSPYRTDTECVLRIPCHWDGSRLTGQTFDDAGKEYMIDLKVCKSETHLVFDGTYKIYDGQELGQGLLHYKIGYTKGT